MSRSFTKGGGVTTAARKKNFPGEAPLLAQSTPWATGWVSLGSSLFECVSFEVVPLQLSSQALFMAQPARRKDGVAFWSVLLVLSTGGLFSFLSGFYPVKPLLPGYTVAPIATSAPAFTKLVFIVIDALRRYDLCL